ncbi:adenosylcobinamide-phosphate synthase CbiB [Acidiphilium acidophilum]|uniref:adenosylcobinamide-phosphate synthase CbiB n=1 Tax=Acidiphilium acidophilum TaxID=76588 RepID=UPI002E8E6620|nr:adenosylcobinamide-phosphate synthase CbiB [Acidiphilium acidophilum]
MIFPITVPLAALSLTIEAITGYPDPIFRLIGHPVVWIGSLITRLDHRLNHPSAPPATRRLMGVFALILILLAAILPAAVLQAASLVLLPRALALLLIALLASALLASRSLATHVRAVERGLARSLADGRAAVSHIVGRAPESLDHAGVARAAIESLAENFSDGVIAPILWCALLGLPGLAAYKAANTADSMIGHRTPRHEAFGWAAARFDDLINLPASRLAALLIIAAAALHPGTDAAAALRAVRRDAASHRSPNAGWPEAAMAGALGLRLAGPRTYGTVSIDDAWMGSGTPDATAADIARALALFRRATILQILLLWLLTLIIWRA